MSVSTISYLTTIQFGDGASLLLAGEAEAVGITRALVVTDKGLVAAGVVEEALTAAPQGLVAAVFDDTPSNPTESGARAAAALYREADCDGIIAIGGGSPIDLAKAAGIMLTHAEPFDSLIAVKGGAMRVRPIPPLIAIPTTAGTGSEVGRGALITLDNHHKVGFVSPHLIPRRALVDPVLTRGLPPILTAATGIDAVSHCIETFVSPRYNPPAEAIALEGLRLAIAALPRAVNNGGDAAARRDMAMAALMGGMTFQKGLGAIHSLSHPLGGLEEVSLHHGMLNAVLLEPVTAFNLVEVPEKMDRLAAVCGLAGGRDLPGFLKALVADLGLKPNLKALGTPFSVRDRIVDWALADHCTPTNPRALDQASMGALFDAAYG